MADSARPNSKPVFWMILSIAFAVISLGVFPLLFGGFALFFGYQAYKRDARLGQVCLLIAGIALIVGIVGGALWGMENIRF